MSRSTREFILIAVIVFGLSLRLMNLLGDVRLWSDEIFSVVLAQSPLLDVILAGTRFDTHPPLYYLQLHVWSFLGESDRWFILNSTLLDVIAGMSIYATCRLRFGPNVALWATAVFAVLPLQFFFAENVRMYPLVAIIEVWLWYFLERIVEERGSTLRVRFVSVCLGIALTLTHGLGFFVAFFLFFQAIARLWRSGGDARLKDKLRLVRPLVLGYALVAVAASYPLVIGAVRQTEGLPNFDLSNIGTHLTLALLGLQFPFPTVSGFAAVAIVLLPPLIMRQSRHVIAYLVALPFLVLLVISVTLKPVFIYRTLGLFLPVLAIGLGLFAEAAVRRGRTFRVLVAGVGLTFMASGLNYSLTFEKDGYDELAAYWDARAADEATLLASGLSDLWGMIRYLPEAERISALQIQPPVRDGMLSIKKRLKGTPLDAAGFFGRADFARAGERRIFPYFPETEIATQPRLWLLNPPGGGCLGNNLEVDRLETVNHLLIECGAGG